MQPSPSESSKVTVVLGGGGTKGYAHVGVLEAIHAAGYEIASIMGTSIGAIVGGLFAYNRFVRYGHLEPGDAQDAAIQALHDICRYTPVEELFDINPALLWQHNVLKGEALDTWLQTHFWLHNRRDDLTFATLPVNALTVTATEIVSGKQLVLGSDPATQQVRVWQAIRASASFQLVFPAADVDINGHRVSCWDGGTTGNCVFDHAMLRKPERLTIASSLTYSDAPAAVPATYWRTALRSAAIMIARIEELTLASVPQQDRKRLLLVRPLVEGVGTFSLVNSEDIDRLIENGRAAAAAILAEVTS